MKVITLKKVDHSYKAGQASPEMEPNIAEDCILSLNGEAIGFFCKNLPFKIKKLSDLADAELRSDRVPKTKMARLTRNESGEWQKYSQYSAIVGSIPPKFHMRRAYPAISSVHGKESAKAHIKSMLMIAFEIEELIKEYMPEQYKKQKEMLSRVPDQWRFGNLFTSGISNCNISARYHQDNANIKNTVNVILTKRKNALGGNLHVPDYGLVFDQTHDSVLVYPAWANLHGVTPIRQTKNKGYRNTLILYSLKAFVEPSLETITA